MKTLPTPAYRCMDFVDKFDGDNFNDHVLERYDDHVKAELRRHVSEDIPPAVTQKFIALAAESRDQLEDFLRSSAHGPH